MRALLKTLPCDSPAILEQLRHWLAEQPGLHTICIYAPLPGEVDVTPMIAAFPEIRWIFPRVEGSALVLHLVADPGRDLEIGAFGIREPQRDLPVVNLQQIDAFLCPGLAFDKHGGRLGRGRGFYDRLLEHARAGALKIGICHKEQMVPDTYREPHDVAMDRIISG